MAPVAGKPQVRKILIIEIDLTHVLPSWVIALQIAELDHSQEIVKHMIIKRKDGETAYNIPDFKDSFVTFVKEENRW